MRVTSLSNTFAHLALSLAPNGAVNRRAILSSASAAALGFMSGGRAVLAEESLPNAGGSVQFCTEDVMSQKGHGTTAAPVQMDLRWGVDRGTADRICSYNRQFA